jgi:surface polysaccharide O-acyltransferase-like enzyme
MYFMLPVQVIFLLSVLSTAFGYWFGMEYKQYPTKRTLYFFLLLFITMCLINYFALKNTYPPVQVLTAEQLL